MNLIEASDVWTNLTEFFLQIHESSTIVSIHLSDNGFKEVVNLAKLRNNQYRPDLMGHEDIPEYVLMKEIFDIF